MIRHIVLFTAKDKDHVDQMIDGLSVLTAIPHARRLEIARNRKTDQLGNDIDVVVYGEFDNETELAAYKAHDLYKESINRVRPLRDLRFAADYNVSAEEELNSDGRIQKYAGPKRERRGTTSRGISLSTATAVGYVSLMHVRELHWIDPVRAMRCLAHRSNLTFLDSATRHALLGRYSYVACDPFSTYMIADGQASCDGEALEGDPWKALRTLLAAYPQEHRPDLPPFQGGAAGFFAYDLNRTLERLPPPAIAGQGLPQSILHFYDVVIGYDHRDERCWIFSTGWPEQDPARRGERARRRADEFAALLVRPEFSRNDSCGMAGVWHSNFTSERYIEAVQRVIDLILAGDIFQANIAQRFTARLPTSFDPLAFYCQLRSLNPAPFAALLLYGKLTIASSSPERFLKLSGRRVETRPIKGTIARSADPKEDQRRAEFLFASEKDRAENIMIVDLLRNDLSRVCTAHSIEVPALCELESYASVHHLVSVITGKLAGEHDAVTLLRACFPGGSITGAPKVRSMEIIAEIERVAREAYCGAIGFIGFNGCMDTNVAIRTVTIDDGLAVFHAGGGITAMSEPAAEYEETLAKAQRIFDAFRAGNSGAS